MKLLLDTHAYIWWDNEPAKLSGHVLNLCSDPGNEIVISIATLWEMQIKSQLGKLSFRLPLPELVSLQQAGNSIVLLPISPAHVYALDKLPLHHRDPFDRMLIAQAMVEGMSLVSADPILSGYTVPIIW